MPFNSFLFLSYLYATLLICGLSVGVWHSWRTWRYELDIWSKILSVVTIGAVGFVLFACRPGLLSFDDVNLHGVLLTLKPSQWHSFGYSFISQAMRSATGLEYPLSFFNFILYAILLIRLALLFEGFTPRWLRWLALPVFLAPQMQILVFFQNRDSTFSLLISLALGELLIWRKRLTPPSNKAIATVCGLVVIAASLRQEAFCYIPLVPAMLWFVYRKGTVLRAALISTTLVFAVFSGIPELLYSTPNYFYQSTTLINPLSHVLYRKSLGELSAVERADMDRFFKVPYLVNFYSPLDIGPFHSGGINLRASKDDYVAFRNTALRVLWRNFPLWLENRQEMAANMLNFTGTPLAFDDSSPATPAKLRLMDRARLFFYPDDPWLRLWWASCLIPLLGCLLWSLTFNFREIAFSVALLLLGRLLIFLVLSPCAYFKYITSFWFMGWILFLLWLEWAWNRVIELRRA